MPHIQKLTVNYQGKDYAANYSTSSSFVEVEVSWGDCFHLKTTRQIGFANPASVARMIALEVLISARDRGELI